jgi:hypothetical protein
MNEDINNMNLDGASKGINPKQVTALKIIIGALLLLIAVAVIMLFSFSGRYSNLQNECSEKLNIAYNSCPQVNSGLALNLTSEIKMDEHGCAISEDYAWCQEKDKCIKRGSEACPSLDNVTAIMVSFE